jgi:hypothetical protein
MIVGCSGRGEGEHLLGGFCSFVIGLSADAQ